MFICDVVPVLCVRVYCGICTVCTCVLWYLYCVYMCIVVLVLCVYVYCGIYTVCTHVLWYLYYMHLYMYIGTYQVETTSIQPI